MPHPYRRQRNKPKTQTIVIPNSLLKGTTTMPLEDITQQAQGKTDEELLSLIKNINKKNTTTQPKTKDFVYDQDLGIEINKSLVMPSFEVSSWNEKIKNKIPARSNYTFNNKIADQLLFALKVGGVTLIHGPTGTGKSSVVKELAARKNIPFFRVSCHNQMESYDFLGSEQVISEKGTPVTKRIDTDTTLAAKYGGILLIDEAFRSQTLMAIQSLLEIPPVLYLQGAHGVSSKLEPESPLFIFLTDNTTGVGDTSGNYIANVQDISTLNRIRTSIYIPFPTESEELSILKNLFNKKIEKEQIQLVVKAANLIRECFLQGKIAQPMSIRNTIDWLENYFILNDCLEAFNLCFSNKLNNDEAKLVLNCYKQVFAGSF